MFVPHWVSYNPRMGRGIVHLPELSSWNAVLGKVPRSHTIIELQAIADAALANDAAARLRLGKVDFATNTRCASPDFPGFLSFKDKIQPWLLYY